MLELFSNTATSLPPAALIWCDGSPQVTSSSTGGSIECTFKKPSKRNGALKHKKAIKKRVHEGGGDLWAAARPPLLIGSDTTRNSPPSGLNLMTPCSSQMPRFAIGPPVSKGMEGFFGGDSIPLCFTSPTPTSMSAIMSPYMFPPLPTIHTGVGKIGGSHPSYVSP